MNTATSLSYIVIVDMSADRVEYQADDGRHWEITGQCNGCGECYVGASDCDYIVWTGTPIGQANACYDQRGGPDVRPDIPVTPECQSYWPNCTLTGKYL